MASNQIAVASNLLAMASNLVVMASNIEATVPKHSEQLVTLTAGVA